ncbi:pre-mRNA-splicing factor CWC22 homolog [Penaeus monodon]|uniref:pre-mRNA-splicing factor CWC22 homolog n=1 Tax=Penaeus monodon TaxID=6687 RepID=UPI0018A78654|nr:pre-mRNA-splicing factor CWC22 homolog [Penaeus monodon]
MEMLDSSYLDDIDDFAANSHFDDEVPGKMERGHTSAEYNSYEPEVRVVRSPSPPQDFIDPLDDVFEIEDFDSQGSMASLGGAVRSKKKAPPPPPTAGPSTSDGKKTGGFFGRVKREKDKDKEKEKEKKAKEKKEKKKDDKPAGKRFQLFGGVKKTGEPSAAEDSQKISNEIHRFLADVRNSEPSAAEDTPTKSPKKDKAVKDIHLCISNG